MPTKRLWLLLALGVPLGAAAALAGAPTFVVVYDLLLGLAAWATWRMAPPVDRLRVVRRSDSVLSVRATNHVDLTVHNDANEPVDVLVRDEAPEACEAEGNERRLRIAAGRSAGFRYSLLPRRRGATSFPGTWVRVACPLGLVERQAVLPTEAPVAVYPNVLALREFDLLSQRGRLREMGVRRSRSRGLGMEFESLRDYAEGDDFRKIDHKASARHGRLVVRQYEREQNQTVLLCLDVGRHMLAEADGVGKLEHVLDAVLMLTHAAAAAGDRIGLMVYADDVRRYVPPRKGRAQTGVVIASVHDLQAEPAQSDPIVAFGTLGRKWNRRSLMVCFTDCEDPDRARELAAALGPMAARHLVLLVRVQDQRLTVAAQGFDDLYRKAAADFLLADRRAALSVLHAARIQTLDSDPERLAADLVNCYLQVKATARL